MTERERESWQRIAELFDRVVDMPQSERDEALAREPAEVRAEVAALLENVDGGELMQRAVAAGLASLSAAGHVGQQVGAYRLIELVGEGGMGVVYLGERIDGEYRGHVAIKILRSGYASTHVGARFRDERQFLAALDHPCIVRLLDAGTTDDRLPYLVMEYVDGVPLTKFARALPIRERVALMVTVARAVQHAHQKLIVHRDLKPSNILVTNDGAPKLLDFGIAKLLESSESLSRDADTRTGLALLTIDYASPEQARGERVSVASDVYSLGAILYELFAARPPHGSSSDPLETLRQVCEVDPPRPSVVARRRELAGDLDNIVARALQKRADDRYPSAAAFADDLERYLAGQPVEAREATFWYRARKLVSRHLAAFLVAAAVMIVLATTTIVALVQARRADAEARRAEIQNRVLLETQGWQELERGDHARALPYLLEALRREDTVATRYLIARALSPFARRVKHVDHAAAGLLIMQSSADGSRILTVGPQGVTIYTDAGQPLFDQRGSRLLAVMNRDGSAVAVLREGRHLTYYDVASGAVRSRLTTPIELGESYLFHVREDEREIVFSSPRKMLSCDWNARTCIERAGRAVAYQGDRIATAEGGDIVLRDLSWQEVDRIALGAEPIVDLRFPTADRIVARVADRLVFLDVTARAVLAQRPGLADAMEISFDRTRLASTSVDHSVRVWDLRTGDLQIAITGLDRRVRTLAWSADGTRVVSTGIDNRYRIWNVQTGAEEHAPGFSTVAPSGRLGGSMGGAIHAMFTLDGKRLVTVAATEMVWWDLEASAQRRTYRTRDGIGLYAASPSPSDERLVAIVGMPGYISLHDLATRNARWEHSIGERHVYDAQWSPDGTRFVAAGAGVARVLRLDGSTERELVGHAGTVNRATFSPDGTSIATAGGDRTMRIWNAATGEPRAKLELDSGVMAVAWSRDGKLLVVAPWNGELRLVDGATFAPISTLATGRQLLDASLSPDHRRLATAAHGGEIEIWDVANGRRIHSCEGHTGPATIVAWSPDGTLLASSGDDLSARLWDPLSCRRLALFAHRGGTMQVMWSSDGERLWVTDNAGRVVEWDVRRETRSIAELDALVVRESPWRLVDGQLQLR